MSELSATSQRFTSGEAEFTGIVLEGFFYGLYSGIFAIYIQYQSKRSEVDKTKNILFYPLCVLYILSTATFVLDIIKNIFENVESEMLSLRLFHILFVSITIIGLCDFISQAILIYRCWVTWGCNFRVIIIPSILALIFLATWLAINGSFYFGQLEISTTDWGDDVTLAALIISLIVNAVATSLIVFRILKVYWAVMPTAFEDKRLGVGGRKLRSVIFIIIESGITMFAIQLIRVVLGNIMENKAAYYLIGINQMFNGIIPTHILVRVSMGLSYHDDKSMVDTLSWCCTSQNQDPVSQIGSVEIPDQQVET